MWQALKHLLNVGKTAGGVAWARITTMLRNDKVIVGAIFIMTFFNLITNLYAAIRLRSGHFALRAIEGLGTTLGGSLSQIIVGLEVVASGNLLSFAGIKSLIVLLMGISTIYIWYVGNYKLIDWLSETQIRLTDHLYITVIMILSVVAYHDASQFYEAFNLSQNIADSYISFDITPETVNEAEEAVNSTLSE